MRSQFNKILLTLLYLTPIGYVLSILDLYSGEKTPGVYVYLSGDQPNKPMQVFVKKNPLVLERVHWFINGISLILQAFTVVYKNIGGNWGLYYVWVASIFGFVNLISSFLPTFNWNGGIIKSVKVSNIGVLVLLALILTLLMSNIYKEFIYK